jgi:hypothetical protein
MPTPHWLVTLAVIVPLGAFIVFAFRQGMGVKPRKVRVGGWWVIPPLSEDRPKDRDD